MSRASHAESHSLVADFQHHTELPTTRLSRVLDRLLGRVGEAFSWLWLAVIGVILVSVISRYVFSEGSVTMEEIQWHISSMVWLVGLSYAFIHDSHVRVDVIHERLSLRKQVWIELLGLLVLALPFLVIGVYMGWPYFHESWLQGEVSQSPAGLPYRWLIKFFMPLAFALLVIAAFSRLLKCTAYLFGRPQPLRLETDAERSVREGPFRHTVVRPSWVYGPEDESLNLFARIVRWVPGAFPQLGDGTQRLNPVFVEDVARAVTRRVEAAGGDDAVFEIGGPVTYTMDGVVRVVMDALDRRKPIVHVPLVLARAGGAVAEMLPGRPFSRGAAEFLVQGAVADLSGFRELFPDLPLTSMPDALEGYLGRKAA